VRVRKNTMKCSSWDRSASRGEKAGLGGQFQAETNSGLLMPTESTQHMCDGNCMHSALGRIFGVDELAVFFGCSTAKIKRRARKRELPAFKFGKSWYVREQDLERYIEQAVESNLRLDQKVR
jgi:excisionase family DNA binding protein